MHQIPTFICLTLVSGYQAQVNMSNVARLVHVPHESPLIAYTKVYMVGSDSYFEVRESIEQIDAWYEARLLTWRTILAKLAKGVPSVN